jgi:hypothetical protein
VIAVSPSVAELPGEGNGRAIRASKIADIHDKSIALVADSLGFRLLLDHLAAKAYQTTPTARGRRRLREVSAKPFFRAIPAVVAEGSTSVPAEVL